MTKSLTISVALASYNGEEFIQQQLESIRSQTRMADEVVVSDGGSTDRTLEIVGAFFASHPEVHGRIVSDGTRLGVTANFERAIVATTGDLVTLSDQDDIWLPGRLSSALNAFVDESVLLAHSDARLVDHVGDPLGIGLFEALGVGDAELRELAEDAAFALLIRRNLVTGATVTVRREFAMRAMPFPRTWVHDEWLAIMAAAMGRLVPVREQPVDYRQHGGNQIGVAAPTLRGRVSRMVERRDHRYERLAARATDLAVRLDQLDVDPRWRRVARRKEAFEQRRAAYGRRRLARLMPILRNAAVGSYSELSSWGRLDVIRDLVQPA